MNDKVLKGITYIASAVVIISSIAYFITQKMIPGLSPFGLAVIMLTMYMREKNEQKNRWLKFLFLITALLNLAAGIMQIYVAYSA